MILCYMKPWHIPPPNKCPLCGKCYGYKCQCDFTERNFWHSLALIYNVDDRIKALEGIYRDKKITDWQLWEVTSNHYSPFSSKYARMVLENLGFVAFTGYPLIKAKNPPKQRQAAFDTGGRKQAINWKGVK